MSLLGFITGRDAGHDRTSIWDDMDNYNRSHPSSSYSSSKAEEKKYYCKYCGQEFTSIRSMKQNGNCGSSPLGCCRGPHEPYEGR